MTAVSPYAPPRRSSSVGSLRRQSSSTLAATPSSQFALFCLILRYWDSPPVRKLRAWLRLDRIVESRIVRGSIDSRLAMLVRGRVVNLIKWAVGVVDSTCRRFGLDEVGANLGELIVGPGFAATRPLTGTPHTGGRSPRAAEETAGKADGAVAAAADAISTPYACSSPNASNDATKIRRNIGLIDGVLTYWFGSSSPETSQKKLWMIASSSVERRKEVDAEIDSKFGQLVCELANDGSNCSDDAKRSIEVEGEQINVRRGQMWDDWCLDDGLYGWRGKVAAVIVLDQMSRHVRRHRLVEEQSPESTTGKDSRPTSTLLPDQDLLDKLALATSTLFRTKHTSQIISGMLPTPMHIFAVMPYRHASTIDTVGLVQQAVEEIAKLEGEIDNMIRRFRTATNRRMAVLQDEARREGRSTLVGRGEIDAASGNEEKKCGADVAVAVGDSDGAEPCFTEGDILEVQHFDADMALARDHPVVKTVVSFLSEVGIKSTPSEANGAVPSIAKSKQRRSKRSHVPNKATATTPSTTQPPKRHVIVSLSGGVDSMVLASVLSYLKSGKEWRYNNLNVVSVHIDYGNRPESCAEASFVRRYSEETLGLPCTVRRIDEVTRGVTARDEYEKVARTVRYDLYRKTVANCLATAKDTERSEVPATPPGSTSSEVGVILGHHRGDLRENVLSNAHRGCGPLDLSGMTSVSRNDGVTIFRPLLSLEKDAIFDYAHKFGVPYFKDTTPHWSTRGKLRNKLLPLLVEIYGDGSTSNLTSLAEESDEARNLVRRAILNPFLNRVTQHPMGISFDTIEWKGQGPYFWKLALRNVLHGAGRGMFSDKSVKSFLERAQADPVRAAWLQCRKDYAVYLREDGRVFVLHPESFPFRKSDRYDVESVAMEYGKEVMVGPWAVTARVLETSHKWDDLEKKKAVESMDGFMTGCISYSLKVPLVGDGTSPTPCQLIFVPEFTKKSRPVAWKNTDLKIERTLPLPGLDAAAARAVSMLDNLDDQYGKGWCWVVVTLSRIAPKGQ